MAHMLNPSMQSDGTEEPTSASDAIVLRSSDSVQCRISIAALREASPFFDDLLAKDVEPGGTIQIPYTGCVLHGIVHDINNLSLTDDVEFVELYAAAKRYQMYELAKKLRQDLFEHFKHDQLCCLNALFEEQRLEYLLELRDVFTVCSSCNRDPESIPREAREIIVTALEHWARHNNVPTSELSALTRLIRNPPPRDDDAENNAPELRHRQHSAYDQVAILSSESFSSVSPHGRIVRHRRRIPDRLQEMLEAAVSPVVIGNKMYFLEHVYSTQIEVYSFDTGEYLYPIGGSNAALHTLTVHNGRLYAASRRYVYLVRNAQFVRLGITKHKMASRLLVTSHSDTGDFHCVYGAFDHSTKFVFMKRKGTSLATGFMETTGTDVEVDYEELIGSTATDLIGCHRGFVYIYGHNLDRGSFVLVVDEATVVRRLACGRFTPFNYMNCYSQICFSEGNVLVIVNISDLSNVRVTKAAYRDNILLVRRSIPIRAH